MFPIGWKEPIITFLMKQRITNIDTLSALIDRLIAENIKRFFFKKDNKIDKVEQQDLIISSIKSKLTELFEEVYMNKEYNYMSENRTFTASSIVEDIEDLITDDLHIGESDRARLRIVMKEEKRLRKSNESRASKKNSIDENFKKMTS